MARKKKATQQQSQSKVASSSLPSSSSLEASGKGRSTDKDVENGNETRLVDGVVEIKNTGTADERSQTCIVRECVSEKNEFTNGAPSVNPPQTAATLSDPEPAKRVSIAAIMSVMSQAENVTSQSVARHGDEVDVSNIEVGCSQQNLAEIGLRMIDRVRDLEAENKRLSTQLKEALLEAGPLRKLSETEKMKNKELITDNNTSFKGHQQATGTRTSGAVTPSESSLDTERRMMEKVKDLEMELSSANQEADEARIEVTDLRRQLSDAVNEKELKVTALNQASSRLASLQQQIERLDNENATMRAEGRGSMKNLMSLKKSQSALEHELDELRTKVEELQKDLDKQTEQTTAERRAKERLKTEVEGFKERCTETEVSNGALQQKLVKVEEQLQVQTRQCNKLEATKAQLRELEAQILKERKRGDRLRVEMDALKQANHRLQNAKVEDVMRMVKTTEQKIRGVSIAATISDEPQQDTDKDDDVSLPPGGSLLDELESCKDADTDDLPTPHRTSKHQTLETSSANATPRIAEDSAQPNSAKADDEPKTVGVKKWKKCTHKFMAINRWKTIVKETVLCLASAELMGPLPNKSALPSPCVTPGVLSPRLTSPSDTPRDLLPHDSPSSQDSPDINNNIKSSFSSSSSSSSDNHSPEAQRHQVATIQEDPVITVPHLQPYGNNTTSDTSQQENLKSSKIEQLQHQVHPQPTLPIDSAKLDQHGICDDTTTTTTTPAIADYSSSMTHPYSHFTTTIAAGNNKTSSMTQLYSTPTTTTISSATTTIVPSSSPIRPLVVPKLNLALTHSHIAPTLIATTTATTSSPLKAVKTDLSVPSLALPHMSSTMLPTAASAEKEVIARHKAKQEVTHIAGAHVGAATMAPQLECDTACVIPELDWRRFVTLAARLHLELMHTSFKEMNPLYGHQHSPEELFGISTMAVNDVLARVITLFPRWSSPLQVLTPHHGKKVARFDSTSAVDPALVALAMEEDHHQQQSGQATVGSKSGGTDSSSCSVHALDDATAASCKSLIVQLLVDNATLRRRVNDYLEAVYLKTLEQADERSSRLNSIDPTPLKCATAKRRGAGG